MLKPSQFPLYRRLFGYTQRYWKIFIVAVIANALYSAVDAGLIQMLQPLIDDVFVAKDAAKIALIPIIVPLAFLLRGSMSFISDYGMSWIGRQVVVVLRQEMFAHLQRLPASFYDRHATGELLSKLSFNVEQFAKASTSIVIDFVRSVFLIGMLLVVMLHTSWKLTLLFLTVGPLVGYLFRKTSQRFRKVSHDIQKTMSNVTHVAEENIKSYRDVRTYGGEKYEINNFNQVTQRNRQLEMKMVVASAASSPLIQCVGGIGLGVTIYFATSHLGPNVLSAGQFSVLISAMIGLLNPLKQLTAVSNKLQQGLAGAESVFSFLDTPVEQDLGTKICHKIVDNIEFRHISFAYPHTEKQILKQIQLNIKSGQTIALVGRSGSGKTSLVSLLPRFYDNYQGSILLDDVDSREYTLTSLRHQFAFVAQQVTLFNDSIAHNVAYAQGEEYDQNALWEALDAAHASEFVKQLPQGVHTLVGENGVLLSGGQRQRLAIARALYKKASVLILDEATSALDNESEAMIQQALAQLQATKRCTTLVIAHRLSTIERADQIIVMEKGNIVEVGTHTDLLEKGGIYTQLYRMQWQAELQP